MTQDIKPQRIDLKIYLDNCSLQRPFDDQSQPRIALETEAVTKIVSLCEAGQLSLITSTALDIEIDQTPNKTRQELTRKTLLVAKESVKLTEQVKARARGFQNNWGGDYS